jgi:hypothetical protein
MPTSASSGSMSGDSTPPIAKLGRGSPSEVAKITGERCCPRAAHLTFGFMVVTL